MVLKRRGFSLVELLIVVVVMGIVYKFTLNSLSDIEQSQHQTKLNLLNLKKKLLQYDFENQARVVCYNDCFTCKVILDNKKEIDIEPFLSQEVVLYSYDNELAEFVEKENEPYFNKENVEKQSCFSFRVFKNGSSEQLYVQSEGKVYWLGDYFKIKVYDSLKDAKEYKENLLQKALL